MKIIWGLVLFLVVQIVLNISKFTKGFGDKDFHYAVGCLLTSIGCIIVFIVYSLCKYDTIL